jgi:hypothetical protein
MRFPLHWRGSRRGGAIIYDRTRALYQRRRQPQRPNRLTNSALRKRTLHASTGQTRSPFREEIRRVCPRLGVVAYAYTGNGLARTPPVHDIGHDRVRDW